MPQKAAPSAGPQFSRGVEQQARGRDFARTWRGRRGADVELDVPDLHAVDHAPEPGVPRDAPRHHRLVLPDSWLSQDGSPREYGGAVEPDRVILCLVLSTVRFAYLPRFLLPSWIGLGWKCDRKPNAARSRARSRRMRLSDGMGIMAQARCLLDTTAVTAEPTMSRHYRRLPILAVTGFDNCLPNCWNARLLRAAFIEVNCHGGATWQRSRVPGSASRRRRP